jgi:hypothetical protein
MEYGEYMERSCSSTTACRTSKDATSWQQKQKRPSIAIKKHALDAIRLQKQPRNESEASKPPKTPAPSNGRTPFLSTPKDGPLTLDEEQHENLARDLNLNDGTKRLNQALGTASTVHAMAAVNFFFFF